MMKSTSQLPQWCIDTVANPPQSGQGFHNWLFRAARALWKCGRDENDIREILRNAAETCGRLVRRKEVEDAIRNAHVSAFQPGYIAQQAWPAVNHKEREIVITSGLGVSDLWEISPQRFDEENTEQIVDQLFPGNPLLCCGKTKFSFDTKPRSQWRGELSKLQFIVPSVMVAWVGKTQEGKDSSHTKEKTGPRRFLVIEQDKGALDEQAAVLLHLAGKAPLVLVVFSGSKSIHGWFFANGQSEERLEKFMRYAVALGADRALWTKSQFTRMPDGTRDNGKRQTVYFFNPKAIEK
jgi:hypothetical protein